MQHDDKCDIVAHVTKLHRTFPLEEGLPIMIEASDIDLEKVELVCQTHEVVIDDMEHDWE